MKKSHIFMLTLSCISVILITTVYLHYSEILQNMTIFVRQAINIYNKDMSSVNNFTGTSGNSIEIIIAFINILVGITIMVLFFKKCYIEDDLEKSNY